MGRSMKKLWQAKIFLFFMLLPFTPIHTHTRLGCHDDIKLCSSLTWEMCTTNKMIDFFSSVARLRVSTLFSSSVRFHRTHVSFKDGFFLRFALFFLNNVNIFIMMLSAHNIRVHIRHISIDISIGKGIMMSNDADNRLRLLVIHTKQLKIGLFVVFFRLSLIKIFNSFTYLCIFGVLMTINTKYVNVFS